MPWPEEGFAPTTQAESEAVIRLDAQDDAVYISSSWPMWSRRFSKRFGRPEKVSRSRDGGVTCAWWKLPLAAFKMPRLPRAVKPKTAAQVEAGRKLAETRARSGRIPRKTT